MISPTKDMEKIKSIQFNQELLDIYIDRDSEYIVSFLSKNYSKKKFEIHYFRRDNTVLITFLSVFGNEDKGLGSLALQIFEDWAKLSGITKLTGELVNGKDSSNPLKLKYFYRKNNYKIVLTGENYVYARISKMLQD